MPPERQEQAVLDYLGREGFAYRQDIARLLGIKAAQCRPILQRMIQQGQLVQLVQEKQNYVLRSVRAEAVPAACPRSEEA